MLTHCYGLRQMGSPSSHSAFCGIVCQPSRTENRPFECVAFNQVFVGFILALHVNWNDSANALGNRYVCFGLVYVARENGARGKGGQGDKGRT